MYNNHKKGNNYCCCVSRLNVKDSSIEKKWENIKEVYQNTSEKIIGFRKSSSKQWLTSDTWKAVDERAKLKEKVLSTRSSRLKEQTQKEYAEKDKEVKKRARKDKKNHLEERAEEAEKAAARGDLSTVYKITKELCGQSKQPPPVKDNNGKIITTEREQAARSYNVDVDKVSISGISSGAGFATQMHVIHSASFIGVGVVAGVPYGCAHGSSIAALACMKIPMFESVSSMEHLTVSEASKGNIDAVSNMKNDRVYVFAGRADTQINPRENQQPRRFCPELLTFDQSEFTENSTSGYSMDKTGYVYIPSGCSQNTKCKLHIALHGCKMGRHYIDDVYVKHTGYNEVGELNNIIILYPQAVPNSKNADGCWDMYGFTGQNYATNKGLQVMAMDNMRERVLGQ
ncbi:unnamed protein product [Mytilus edulis]|uniref:Uncharacterized protein n=1 Tax=Mytilus edulis TaxID=6550 RepID=A0A8S3T017_MYTED|nr:unnamed protein product [Mytilus edulis]